MIATPICYDQFDNAEEIVKLGIGKAIKFTDITEENLSQALIEVRQILIDTTKSFIHLCIMRGKGDVGGQ